MIKQFVGRSWDEVNKPKQKQPIRDSFPDMFKRIKVFPHTNFQLGDSGISDHFAQLVHTALNKKGHTSVVGVYNNLIKVIEEGGNAMDF
jgi:hypothetical protein